MYQSTCLITGFRFLNFDLEFLTGVQSFKALTAKIYLITNGLRGRQVLMFLQKAESADRYTQLL